MLLAGAYDLRPPVELNMLAVELRWTEAKPRSARLLPDDERWNIGWLGRPGARDMREPEVERAWLLVLVPVYGGF